jgi:alpha-ribazole phosphatase
MALEIDDSSVLETRLWLLRHPEPEAFAQGRCYGSLDVGLSPQGVRQADEVANALVMEPLAAIYTSPSRRCAEAAAKIVVGRTCPVGIMDELRELNFGEFEGRTYEEIAALYPEIYRQWMERPTDVRFPGGECLVDMVARVVTAENTLRLMHAGQSVAVVTHAGAIRIILGRGLGMDLANIFRIGQGYGAVNLVRYFGSSPVVELMNAHANLWRRDRDSNPG